MRSVAATTSERAAYVDIPPSNITSNRVTLSRGVLDALPLRELRSVLQAYDLDLSACLERRDLITVLEQCREIELVD